LPCSARRLRWRTTVYVPVWRPWPFSENERVVEGVLRIRRVADLIEAELLRLCAHTHTDIDARRGSAAVV
jgi:hypothetical protein